jgi:dTDP-glucose 4,6-dehydratase
MNKIFVLGSGSFAGSQFIDHALKNGSRVVGINRSAETSPLFLPYKNSKNINLFKFYQFDINHHFEEICALLNSFCPDVIVDFAGQGMVAESWSQPEHWYQTNILSKVKLHRFLVNKQWLKKYIRISTPEVYGSSDSLISESQSYNPSTPYAVSHAAIDMSLKAFQKQFDFPVVFTRFSNFYGPGQQLYRIIPRTILYAYLGKKLPLHGGGHAVRAFVHANDICSGIQSTILSGVIGETYHFSTSDFVTIRQLVQKIHQIMDVNHDEFVEVTEDRPGKDLKYLMSDKKSQRELSWKPSISLDEGLLSCCKWVGDNFKELCRFPLNYEHKV